MPFPQQDGHIPEAHYLPRLQTKFSKAPFGELSEVNLAKSQGEFLMPIILSTIQVLETRPRGLIELPQRNILICQSGTERTSKPVIGCTCSMQKQVLPALTQDEKVNELLGPRFPNGPKM